MNNMQIRRSGWVAIFSVAFCCSLIFLLPSVSAAAVVRYEFSGLLRATGDSDPWKLADEVLPVRTEIFVDARSGVGTFIPQEFGGMVLDVRGVHDINVQVADLAVPVRPGSRILFSDDVGTFGFFGISDIVEVHAEVFYADEWSTVALAWVLPMDTFNLNENGSVPTFSETQPETGSVLGHETAYYALTFPHGFVPPPGSGERTRIGDANLDGEFNSSDLVQVFQAGEYEDSLEMNSNWSTGDWNGDGEFDSGDLVLAFQDGGYEQGPLVAKTVPEPSSLLLLAIGFIANAAFRRLCGESPSRQPFA